jgi:hypothetical protein
VLEWLNLREVMLRVIHSLTGFNFMAPKQDKQTEQNKRQSPSRWRVCRS